jgi:hypothetical protein
VERNKEARREIQSFLRALDSYPACFAIDPKLSFEQHCANVTTERTITSGPDYRLAGGTIPFIRKYTTICP